METFQIPTVWKTFSKFKTLAKAYTIQKIPNPKFTRMNWNLEFIF
jgi:hypothetical protein